MYAFRSARSFNLTEVQRIPGYPVDYGEHVNVSFYVINPSNSMPVRQKVLASILLTQESYLENTALRQQIVLHTSAEPSEPPSASAEQMVNSVVIRISSFTRNRVCIFQTLLNNKK